MIKVRPIYFPAYVHPLLMLSHADFLCSGTLANDVHFQAYLMEGIARWNDDRAKAAVSSSTTDFRHFSDPLRTAANQLSGQTLGDPVDSGFYPANLYTGFCLITAA